MQRWTRCWRLLSVLLALVLVACGDPGPLPSVSGTVFLHEAVWPGGYANGGPCTGNSNIHKGTQVIVKDGEGNTLGVGELGSGDSVDIDNGGFDCAFQFELELVDEASFYTIEIAGRSGPTYTQADMEELEWTIGLSLD